MTPNQSNVLPGMLCNGLEFFVVENVVKAIRRGQVIDFTELPTGIIELLREEINKDEELKAALLIMQPESEWKRLEQFVSCRFGGLDFKGDIIDGQFQNGEFWNCPNRGNCAHEGVVCKLPVINDYRLTPGDVKLMQLSTSEMTNDVIAEELNIPLGSFHKQKAQLHHILGVQTKQGLTKFCQRLNLI